LLGRNWRKEIKRNFQNTIGILLLGFEQHYNVFKNINLRDLFMYMLLGLDIYKKKADPVK
jgi:hypothetical protein